jgi:ribosomal protein S19
MSTFFKSTICPSKFLDFDKIMYPHLASWKYVVIAESATFYRALFSKLINCAEKNELVYFVVKYWEYWSIILPNFVGKNLSTVPSFEFRTNYVKQSMTDSIARFSKILCSRNCKAQPKFARYLFFLLQNDPA